MGKSGIVAALALTLAVSVNAETWSIDRSHSSVGFTVRHLVVSKTSGSFNDFEGTINYDGKNLSTASVDMTVQAASVDTRDEKRDGHLRSGDFFLVDSFPTLTFKSTKAIPVDETNFQLVGDLTIRGVTKEVTFDVEALGVIEAFGGKRAGFTATTTIDRQEFGVNWNKTLDGGGLVVSDKVDIRLEIEAILAQPKG